MKLQDIDFKLWDKKKAKFVDLNRQSIVFLKDDLQIEGKFILMFPNFICSPVLNADDFEICLCTGFYDKEGNKIYEGDILKCWNDNHYEDGDDPYALGSTAIPLEESEKHYDFFRIRFDKELGFASVDLLPLSYIIGDYDCVDVIGNIHENPELLGEEKK